MSSQTYESAVQSGAVVEWQAGQLATSERLNANIKAGFDNTELLRTALEQNLQDLTNSVNQAFTNIQGDVSVEYNSLKKLEDKIRAVNLLLSSNDLNPDTIQEVVAFIKDNKTFIDNLSLNKVSKSDVIDDLTHSDTDKPLSANQGKVVKAELDNRFTKQEINDALAQKSNSNHVHDVASASVAGFMSTADKIKLSGIEDGANRYIHPDAHPASMITTDATHQFVTLSEKQAWDAKLDAVPTFLIPACKIYNGANIPTTLPSGTIVWNIDTTKNTITMYETTAANQVTLASMRKLSFPAG